MRLFVFLEDKGGLAVAADDAQCVPGHGMPFVFVGRARVVSLVWCRCVYRFMVRAMTWDRENSSRDLGGLVGVLVGGRGRSSIPKRVGPRTCAENGRDEEQTYSKQGATTHTMPDVTSFGYIALGNLNLRSVFAVNTAEGPSLLRRGRAEANVEG